MLYGWILIFRQTQHNYIIKFISYNKEVHNIEHLYSTQLYLVYTWLQSSSETSLCVSVERRIGITGSRSEPCWNVRSSIFTTALSANVQSNVINRTMTTSVNACSFFSTVLQIPL